MTSLPNTNKIYPVARRFSSEVPAHATAQFERLGLLLPQQTGPFFFALRR